VFVLQVRLAFISTWDFFPCILPTRVCVCGTGIEERCKGKTGTDVAAQCQCLFMAH
jgi:hypothetical protein